ncbi:MAG: hypothetical protein K2G88_08940 [Oscillospiraceae bacterium]|nr:hypothetical protein [Oscillospiraceae bacterium]
MNKFEETSKPEIIITFFEYNRTIVFKATDYEKFGISDNFLLVETKNKVYLYNCSAIKSIEIT